jgi:hypothetical protein
MNAAAPATQVDLGGNKACLRLGPPYGRYSSKEGRQVANSRRINSLSTSGRKKGGRGWS